MPSPMSSSARIPANKIIDDILELLNKNGLTSHHSLTLLGQLNRIIEMGQRLAKGATD